MELRKKEQLDSKALGEEQSMVVLKVRGTKWVAKSTSWCCCVTACNQLKTCSCHRETEVDTFNGHSLAQIKY